MVCKGSIPQWPKSSQTGYKSWYPTAASCKWHPKYISQKGCRGLPLGTDGKGRLRIEIQTSGAIFHFTQVCDMIRERWKKIGIRADLADALWRGGAMTLQVSLPLEHPYRLGGMFSSHRS